MSINDIPVTQADMGLIRSLLDGATTKIKMVGYDVSLNFIGASDLFICLNRGKFLHLSSF